MMIHLQCKNKKKQVLENLGSHQCNVTVIISDYLKVLLMPLFSM